MGIVKETAAPPIRSGELETLNRLSAPPLSRETLFRLNRPSGTEQDPSRAARPPVFSAPGAAPGPAARVQPLPVQAVPGPAAHPGDSAAHLLRRGQKRSLFPENRPRRLFVCFDWQERDPRCGVDASAFFLDASGKVPDESWFLFYGQPRSPDGSFSILQDSGGCRERMAGDLRRLSPAVRKIVFVLTIHEALERGLNFSMLQNVSLRLLDAETGRELAAYCPEDHSETVTSMTLGELYLHGGEWRLNPVGNGVRRDLAGQCALYGVQTV